MPLGVASVGHRKRLLAGIANLGLAYGRDLAVHLGIASGEVVAGGLAGTGRREYSVVGDSVNLAARQVAMAKPGQTLVSDPVYRRSPIARVSTRSAKRRSRDSTSALGEGQPRRERAARAASASFDVG